MRQKPAKPASAPQETGASCDTVARSVRIVAEPFANADSVTALDIVFVYDDAVVSALPKSAGAWFEQKAALVAAHPQALDVVSVSVPPATVVTPALPRRALSAVEMFAYADYEAATGQAALRLTQLHAPVIVLAPQHVSVRDGP